MCVQAEKLFLFDDNVSNGSFWNGNPTSWLFRFTGVREHFSKKVVTVCSVNPQLRSRYYRLHGRFRNEDRMPIFRFTCHRKRTFLTDGMFSVPHLLMEIPVLLGGWRRQHASTVIPIHQESIDRAQCALYRSLLRSQRSSSLLGRRTP